MNIVYYNKIEIARFRRSWDCDSFIKECRAILSALGYDLRKHMVYFDEL